jgi:hypothetical protein
MSTQNKTAPHGAGAGGGPGNRTPDFKAERRLPAIGMYKFRGVVKAYVVFLVLISVLVVVFLLYVMNNCVCTTSTDPYVARMKDKLGALAYLNEKRAENGAPPLQLIELNVAKWRAEYVVRTGHRSVYDLEGRHPNYWYTRLDGAMYGGAKEVLAWIRYPNNTFWRYGFKDGIDEALRGYWGHMLNPCYNYIAMETAHTYESDGLILYRVDYYVFWLAAKWINWTSPPLYQDGRFTVEGYAHPVMRPIALVVRYSPYNGAPFIKNTYDITAYNLGDAVFCKYLDPPAPCNNVPEPNGTVTVSRMLDSGNWYVKIDMSVKFDKPGLYTFELLAQDLRDQNRKCPIMQYTIEVPKTP